MELNYKHINNIMINDTLQYYEKVSHSIIDFCKPLNDCLGIKLFTYFKVYKDSRYMFLSNDLNLTKDFICNARYGKVYYRDYLDTKTNYEAILWPKKPEIEEMELVCRHGYWNGMMLWQHHSDGIEGYAFLSDRDNHEINEFFVKNSLILEKFSDHFKTKFGDNIIKEGEKYLKKFEDGCEFSLPVRKIENNNQNIQAFLTAIGIDNCSFKINGEMVKLTPRELQCLELISNGLSLKMVGKRLSLSPRTVEVHINNIKQKTGYNYKYDLMRLYQNELIKF